MISVYRWDWIGLDWIGSARTKDIVEYDRLKKGNLAFNVSKGLEW